MLGMVLGGIGILTPPRRLLLVLHAGDQARDTVEILIVLVLK